MAGTQRRARPYDARTHAAAVIAAQSGSTAEPAFPCGFRVDLNPTRRIDLTA
jgi:hypothetical protein